MPDCDDGCPNDPDKVEPGACGCGVPDDDSQFVNGSVADRIMQRQLDLVKADQKSAEAAMRTAAREINEEIQKTLERDPSLKKRYEELTGSGGGS